MTEKFTENDGGKLAKEFIQNNMDSIGPLYVLIAQLEKKGDGDSLLMTAAILMTTGQRILEKVHESGLILPDPSSLN